MKSILVSLFLTIINQQPNIWHC